MDKIYTLRHMAETITIFNYPNLNTPDKHKCIEKLFVILECIYNYINKESTYIFGYMKDKKCQLYDAMSHIVNISHIDEPRYHNFDELFDILNIIELPNYNKVQLSVKQLCNNYLSAFLITHNFRKYKMIRNELSKCGIISDIIDIVEEYFMFVQYSDNCSCIDIYDKLNIIGNRHKCRLT